MVETIQWTPAGVVMIDQTKLPREVVYVTCKNYEEVAVAIVDMIIRGAPAIGVAAAMGVAIGALQADASRMDEEMERICARLAGTRPTAVNLFWAIDRMKWLYASLRGKPVEEIRAALVAEAQLVKEEDIEINRAMGRHGAPLVPEGKTVLTHCNAGALATVAYGTALSVLYAAHAQGKRFRVFADETRPLLQGARLTAYELQAAGLDVTVLCDGAAASLLASGQVQMVIVGADRIAANGDTANKIGTYGLALAARAHEVPFYVAAPRSTFDLSIRSGAEIRIEERAASEVGVIGDREIVPKGVSCWNPAFDVTPSPLIAGFVTESGVLQPVPGHGFGEIFDPRGLK
ncbi:MAG: S-methyl-5-thioribose-1-phosphate isomerase [Polyangiaceae bacterium]|nr:S-methyl-5-thioribose-1-phosphate isomerase [Polyangiaceae bacterium]